MSYSIFCGLIEGKRRRCPSLLSPSQKWSILSAISLPLLRRKGHRCVADATPRPSRKYLNTCSVVRPSRTKLQKYWGNEDSRWSFLPLGRTSTWKTLTSKVYRRLVPNSSVSFLIIFVCITQQCFKNTYALLPASHVLIIGHVDATMNYRFPPKSEIKQQITWVLTHLLASANWRYMSQKLYPVISNIREWCKYYWSLMEVLLPRYDTEDQSDLAVLFLL